MFDIRPNNLNLWMAKVQHGAYVVHNCSIRQTREGCETDAFGRDRVTALRSSTQCLLVDNHIRLARDEVFLVHLVMFHLEQAAHYLVAAARVLRSR